MKTQKPPDQPTLDKYVSKWIDIGLSTKPINVEAALSALKIAYENVGAEFPKKHEIYDSPFEAITEMKIRHNVDVSYNDFIYGSQDGFWLSYYDCIKQEYHRNECEPLQPFIDCAEHMGWALIYDELVVLTRKPIYIKFDENKLTHCENDLAIKYRDGTGVAIWHGNRIPQEWVFDKSSITPDIVLHWENIEQRRCACEILGWANVIKLLDGIVIDKDSDDTIGTLMEVNLPDIGKEKFLIAKDPNVDALVGLPVPPEMKTALEANSWTYGIDMFEFKPDLRV